MLVPQNAALLNSIVEVVEQLLLALAELRDDVVGDVEFHLGFPQLLRIVGFER